jgi:GAF domain-containing protein
VELPDIVITPQLARRPGRRAARDADHAGLTRIARSMEGGPQAILAAICDLALEYCEADSAGLSVLRPGETEGFRWEALAGTFSPYLYGTAPRHHSPCGYAIDVGAPQLFTHPERYFTWLGAAGIPIAEGLVVPLYDSAQVAYGALWVMTHADAEHFCAADAQLMQRLGGHVGAALALERETAQRGS